MKRHLLFATLLACAASAQTPDPKNNHDLGFKDTPMLPGLPWHVHDPDRPHPPVVTPAALPGGAPSDAIVLFDGHDLSRWQSHASAGSKAGNSPAEWSVGDGYVEVVKGAGDLATKEKFGDVQLHVECSSPNSPTSTSQDRGNSGVYLMGRYEVQVLDPWNNPTYADGQAGAIYGQWPPLENPGRKPGEWNVYDIVFEAPRLDGEKLLKPAVITVFFNGVLVQNHKEAMGPTVHRQVARYVAQPAEDSIVLQNHGNPVRYRNIWVRRLHGYDEPEKK
jgi:hypothetical protein